MALWTSVDCTVQNLIEDTQCQMYEPHVDPQLTYADAVPEYISRSSVDDIAMKSDLQEWILVFPYIRIIGIALLDTSKEESAMSGQCIQPQKRDKKSVSTEQCENGGHFDLLIAGQQIQMYIIIASNIPRA